MGKLYNYVLIFNIPCKFVWNMWNCACGIKLNQAGFDCYKTQSWLDNHPLYLLS